MTLKLDIIEIDAASNNGVDDRALRENTWRLLRAGKFISSETASMLVKIGI